MNGTQTICTGCSGGHPECRCLREKTRGVLLINLGTPDDHSVPAVRRYLREFLSDPYVIKLPPRWKWMTPALGRLIAQFRAKQSAHSYRTIWDDRGSPLRYLTEDQVDGLQSTLSGDWQVFYAMRYGNPSIPDTMDAITGAGITDLIVIPMYPQYSGPTTGTALSVLYQWLENHDLPVNVEIRNVWYNDTGYIESQAQLIYEFATERGLNPANSYLLYSTHSMPQSYIRDGDPYEGQVRESMRLVNWKLGWPEDRTALSFQSKLGPVPWLEPSTEDSLRKLAEAGEKKVIVCPISFTADCLETIEELGITYREMYEGISGGEMHLCPSLNAHDSFIKALSTLVRRGPHPVRTDTGKKHKPLFNGAQQQVDENAWLDELVMVGVSTEGRLGDGEGPAIRHISEDEFNQAKRPQLETLELLKGIKSKRFFSECFVWNTCTRFECYGWLDRERKKSENGRLLDAVRAEIFGPDTDAGKINVLRGREAWHHLLRTAAGLNSTLPGDVEVAEQLESAQRMAQHAETAGAMTKKLINRATTTERRIRNTTAWGCCGQNYCQALVSQLFPDPRKLQGAKVVVIGGSVTSHGILKALGEKETVPSDRFTLIYRGYRKGRLIKMLREAVGEGECVLVERYDEPHVMRAIADADVLFICTDHREPILHREKLLAMRDLSERPITVVDFNSFGSFDEMASIDGARIVSMSEINDEIEVYSEALVAREGFRDAVGQVERAIADDVNPKRKKGKQKEQPPAEQRNGEAKKPNVAASRRNGEPKRNGAFVSVNTNGHHGHGEDLRVGLPVVDRDDFQRYAGLSLPRHVSYPMPNWWKEMTLDDAQAMYDLSNANENPFDLSLYLHIPFCEKMCKFCGCNRVVLRKNKKDAEERTEAYVTALLREIEQIGKRFPGRRVGQIHWGGGTPTYLSCRDIIRIHKKTAECFRIRESAEISIEIDPRVTSHEQLRVLRELGFNRVSMGVQDFDEQVQKHVHRVQPYELVRECVESCREVGFPSVNFDLIYGLPYQTLETIADTVEKAIELSPDRVAFYHYAQIPEKIANQRGIHHDHMADSNGKLDMLLLAHKKFTDAGYEFIGLDHFAKPSEGLAEAQRTGQITRNFQGMTTGRGFDLLGLGASSISQIKNVGYLQNVHSPEEYVQHMHAGEPTITRGVRFTEDDLVRQALLNDLYCNARVEPETLEKQFGIDYKEYFARELEVMKQLEADGLVVTDGDGRVHVLFPLGRVLMRNVAAAFDAYLDPEAYRGGAKHAFSASA